MMQNATKMIEERKAQLSVTMPVPKQAVCIYSMLRFNGPSWPWSYGSWIYNYLYSQCLSPLKFESRSGRGVQHYVIKFVSDLRQVGGFLRVLRFHPPIKLTATI